MSYNYHHQTPLYAWLRKNRYFQWSDPENAQKGISHLCLDGAHGGKICLPPTPAIHRDFLRLYSDDLDNGIKYYLSEQRTPVFRFYFDLDIKRKEPAMLLPQSVPDFVQTLDNASIDSMVLQYCRDMLATVRLFYPPDTDPELFRMTICRRDNATMNREDDPKMMSIGVHAVMENLLVSANQALVMRGAAVGRFKQTYGLMEDVQNSWDEILDEAVYVSNGLRMLGSRKMVKCPECKNSEKKKVDCDVCLGRGKQDIGRVYSAWKVLDVEGREDVMALAQLKRSLHRQIEVTCVRVFSLETTANWKPYGGCPSVPTAADGSVEVELDGKVVRRFKEDADVLNKIRNKIFLPREPEKFQELEKYLRVMINPKYERISIDHIFTNPKGEWFVIQVTGDGSSYCMNIGRDHHNNSIYFLLSKEGIFQKCYCRCLTTKERKYGMCKDYSSKRYDITEKLRQYFFKSPAGSNARAENSHDALHMMMETRNDTLKRSTTHTHLRTVNRSINYLRAWLREKYEIRQGIRPAVMTGADRPTSATTGQRKRKYAGGGGSALKPVVKPVSDDVESAPSAPPDPKKKKAPKRKVKATEEEDEDDCDLTCP